MVFTARVCRLEQHCTPRTVKQWLSCRVHHGRLTSHQLAERAEIRHDQLLKFANENQAEQIPAVALVRLCRVIDDWTAFDLLLAPDGYRLMRIDAAPQKPLIEETLDVAASMGAVVSSVQQALPNGIDAHEAARIASHIDELHRQADELKRALPRDGGVH